VNGIDTRGKDAAGALHRGAERLGPAPDLGDLRRRRRRRSLVRAGLAAVAVAVAVAVAGQALPAVGPAEPGTVGPAGSAPTPPTDPSPGASGLDPRVRQAIPLRHCAAAACDLVAGPGGVWALTRYRGGERSQLVRMDPRTGAVVAAIPVGLNAGSVRLDDDGSVWVVRQGASPGSGELLRVSPDSNAVSWTVPLPAVAPGAVEAVLAAYGSVWIADSSGRLLRAGGVSGRVVEVLPAGQVPRIGRLAAAGGWIWAATARGLLRLDPRDGNPTRTVSDPRLRAALPASGLAGGAGALWVVGGAATGQRLLRLDPDSGRVQASIALGGVPAGTPPPVVATVEQTVAVRRGPVLVLVDAGADRIRARVTLPGDGAMAAGGGAVWAVDRDHERLLRVDPGP
jgi:hypothetical protein